MSNDTSITAIFDHAKLSPFGPVEFPYHPVVYATWVEQYANSHPPGSTERSDLVKYANGPLTLSIDKKTLTGELKIWRNIYTPGLPGIFDVPATPADAFDDVSGPLTVVLSIKEDGSATYQWKLKGLPIGGMPPSPLKATYDSGLMVEKAGGGLRSLSFTLGWIQHD